jgi:hypothetical protein
MKKLNVSVPLIMNTTVHGTLVLWSYSYRAYDYEVFLMMGDYGWYSPISFENL